ncbi:hypothetical protein HY440_02385 [Candidatus Microgenomates bacterium]|nr:hypothetical protein [Candidatus Microgenomates bacterium]
MPERVFVAANKTDNPHQADLAKAFLDQLIGKLDHVVAAQKAEPDGSGVRILVFNTDEGPVTHEAQIKTDGSITTTVRFPAAISNRILSSDKTSEGDLPKGES